MSSSIRWIRWRSVLRWMNSSDDVLGGQLDAASAGTAAGTELTWPGGKRIRLVRQDGLPLGGALHHIRFTRTSGAFSAQERDRAHLLAKHLGLALELAG